jgi:hypothetical protein
LCEFDWPNTSRVEGTGVRTVFNIYPALLHFFLKSEEGERIGNEIGGEGGCSLPTSA